MHVNTQNNRIQTEHQLLKLNIGFTAAFLAIQYLYQHLETHPNEVTKQTVLSLLSLLGSEKFEKKKQSFFLYKEAANALIHLAKDAQHPFAGMAIFKLQDLLINSRGKKHRAVSEALGALPVGITSPDIPRLENTRPWAITLEELTHHLGIKDLCTLKWHGRTLRGKGCDGNINCIKFAKSAQDIENLKIEAQWLAFLSKNSPCRDAVFKVPKLLSLYKNHIFTFSSPPDILFRNKEISRTYTAIVYIADPHYFHYPNDPGIFDFPGASIREIFERNACLLGTLAANGMIHTALIPLFHNRVQSTRREDGGIYQWELGGRLDKWLESTRYPNFARSGLRDFEHIIAIKDTRKLRHFIGEHILGFVLVIGSFFRNKAPDEIGFDPNGRPVDTQHHFDRPLFLTILHDVVRAYYKCITGVDLKNLSFFLTPDLVDELVNAMGIDQFMEETLRGQDQINMTNDEFTDFLRSRGMGTDQIEQHEKGKADIVLNTGPHLGGFNQPISVPGLVDFLFCLSSLCISDRYVVENRLKAFVN